MSSRPCRRPANCHRHLGTFVRFHRHSKAIIHEYLRAQAYTFNLVQRSCHICLHILCARVVAYIRKCIFRYNCGYRSALLCLVVRSVWPKRILAEVCRYRFSRRWWRHIAITGRTDFQNLAKCGEIYFSSLLLFFFFSAGQRFPPHRRTSGGV